MRVAPRFHVEIVPVGTTYAAAPAVDQAKLDQWRAKLVALLRVSDVELTLGTAFESGRDLSTEAAWGLLLGDLAARRAAAGADPSVFTYGLSVPVPITGIGGIAATTAVESSYWRVAAGVVQSDPEQETTIAAHELGHALGRSHAPCGNPAGIDYAYPYTGASIGVVGLDLRDGGFRPPDQYVDVMSYCGPVFISDYQFGALYESLEWISRRRRDAGAAAVATFTFDSSILADRGQP